MTEVKNNKLLIICGPTATGKTSLALSLAEKIPFELVSADSRQVYKHMDVITGKDFPEGAHYEKSPLLLEGLDIGYYKTQHTKIWGYDLVYPDEEFSVYHYSVFARLVIRDILGRGKLPIIVGGTGLYINSILNNLFEIYIPPNFKLRESLKNKSSRELFEMLESIDPLKAESLNESDSKNPVRLIRKIEIAQSSRVSQPKKADFPYDVLKICLNISEKDLLDKKIDERVEDRVGPELDKEIDFLLQHDYEHAAPKHTIGYTEWFKYVNSGCTKDEALKKWKQKEHNYAKRQLTWFRKQKNMQWFNIDDLSCRKKVEDLVSTWHNKT